MSLPVSSTPPLDPLPQQPDASGKKPKKILHSQAREIVANVIKFMKDEANNHRLRNKPLIPLVNFRERIQVATGVSERLYRTITKELEAVASGTTSTFVTPRKNVTPGKNVTPRKKPKKKRYELIEGKDNDNMEIKSEFIEVKMEIKSEIE